MAGFNQSAANKKQNVYINDLSSYPNASFICAFQGSAQCLALT